jgi:hypothetical protein
LTHNRTEEWVTRREAHAALDLNLEYSLAAIAILGVENDII